MINQVISVNLPEDAVKQLQHTVSNDYEIGTRLSAVIADIIKEHYKKDMK